MANHALSRTSMVGVFHPTSDLSSPYLPLAKLCNSQQVRTLGGRLSFLLNKMQSDEESRVILKEESKKTEAQASLRCAHF